MIKVLLATAAVCSAVLAGCGDDSPGADPRDAAHDEAGVLGAVCDGSIEYGGVVYLPLGGGDVAGIPDHPSAGRFLGKGVRLPCDDTPNDGDPSPLPQVVRVYAMVGVPVGQAVMAGEGPEPMTVAPD